MKSFRERGHGREKERGCKGGTKGGKEGRKKEEGVKGEGGREGGFLEREGEREDEGE